MRARGSLSSHGLNIDADNSMVRGLKSGWAFMLIPGGTQATMYSPKATNMHKTSLRRYISVSICRELLESLHIDAHMLCSARRQVSNGTKRWAFPACVLCVEAKLSHFLSWGRKLDCFRPHQRTCHIAETGSTDVQYVCTDSRRGGAIYEARLR